MICSQVRFSLWFLPRLSWVRCVPPAAATRLLDAVSLQRPSDIQTMLDMPVPLATPEGAGENGTPIVEQRVHALASHYVSSERS